MMPTAFSTQSASYRDPSGFVFEKDGVIYRQVNQVFAAEFDFFVESGCYQSLSESGLLIRHKRVAQNLTNQTEWHATLLPEKIDFISYPYEWSFDMLKDAALLTLRLAREAVAFGVLLKDATPYNIQWHKGRLVFIDTLSFAKYDPGQPWIAYRQFCECFLAPLLLMHHSKSALQQLMVAYPEGIPLQILKSLLPFKSRFSLYTYLHVFLHAQLASGQDSSKKHRQVFSKQKFLNLIASLESLVSKLRLPETVSNWSHYYAEASRRSDYLDEKKKIVGDWLGQIPGIRKCADLGANDGEFSALSAERAIPTLAADFDPGCINRLYLRIKKSGEKHIQPLIIDLANPSAGIGVNNKERNSFIERVDSGLVLALALIHHLCIGRNIPFELVAEFFSRITALLIIEFVPKTDPKIQLMLAGKKDIYARYTAVEFEKVFRLYFEIEKKQEIAASGRILYQMKAKT